ncbi:MAG TPA: hypothetical protein VJP87_13620 [Candidatus Acidoferrales bacterium]|nr:hypothetical protein [Candidatus Acidoferrales bacterium]
MPSNRSATIVVQLGRALTVNFLRRAASFCASLLLLSSPCLAFQSPLSDESVREAYFLGQRSDETASTFFSSYLRTFDRPESGPIVSEIELYTPFVQVVEASRLRTAGYSAQQALQDYRTTTDTLFLRIRIEFSPTYATPQYLLTAPPPKDRNAPPPQRADFAHDFRIALLQGDQPIEPLSLRPDLTNTVPTGHLAFDPDGLNSWIHNEGRGSGSAYGVTGWLVWLSFDPNDFATDQPVTVVISGPTDQTWKATFDLSHLR